MCAPLVTEKRIVPPLVTQENCCTPCNPEEKFAPPVIQKRIVAPPVTQKRKKSPVRERLTRKVVAVSVYTPGRKGHSYTATSVPFVERV